MDRLLGEPVDAGEIVEKDLVWHNGAFRAVVKASNFNGFCTFHTIDGYRIDSLQSEKVMRGHRFLVGRRLD